MHKAANEAGHIHFLGLGVLLLVLVVAVAAFNMGSASVPGGLPQEQESLLGELENENALMKKEIERLQDKLRKGDQLCEMLREHDAQGRRKRVIPGSTSDELAALRKKVEESKASVSVDSDSTLESAESEVEDAFPEKPSK